MRMLSVLLLVTTGHSFTYLKKYNVSFESHAVLRARCWLEEGVEFSSITTTELILYYATNNTPELKTIRTGAPGYPGSGKTIIFCNKTIETDNVSLKPVEAERKQWTSLFLVLNDSLIVEMNHRGLGCSRAAEWNRLSDVKRITIYSTACNELEILCYDK